MKCGVNTRTVYDSERSKRGREAEANAAKAPRWRATGAAGSRPCCARGAARLPTAPRTRDPRAPGARAGASAAHLSAARKSSCALFISLQAFSIVPRHHKPHK